MTQLNVNKRFTRQSPKSFAYSRKLEEWRRRDNNYDCYKEFDTYLGNLHSLELLRLAGLTTIIVNLHLESVVAIDLAELNETKKAKAEECGRILLNEMCYEFKHLNSHNIIQTISLWLFSENFFRHILNSADTLLREHPEMDNKYKNVIALGTRNIYQCNNNRLQEEQWTTLKGLTFEGRVNEDRDTKDKYIYTYKKYLERQLVDYDCNNKYPIYVIKKMDNWVLLKPTPTLEILDDIVIFIEEIDCMLDQLCNGEFLRTTCYNDYENIKNQIDEYVNENFSPISERSLGLDITFLQTLDRGRVTDRFYYRWYIKNVFRKFINQRSTNAKDMKFDLEDHILDKLSLRPKSDEPNKDSYVRKTYETFDDFIEPHMLDIKQNLIEKIKYELNSISKKADVAYIIIALEKLGYIRYSKSSKTNSINKLHKTLQSLVSENIGSYRHLNQVIDNVEEDKLTKYKQNLTIE